MERYTLRQMGDAWAVDASYRREIYVARPIKDYPLSTKERAEGYLRSCEKREEEMMELHAPEFAGEALIESSDQGFRLFIYDGRPNQCQFGCEWYAAETTAFVVKQLALTGLAVTIVNFDG